VKTRGCSRGQKEGPPQADKAETRLGVSLGGAGIIKTLYSNLPASSSLKLFAGDKASYPAYAVAVA